MAIVVGVTGNIASGESAFGAILQELDYKVIDSDEIVRDLYSYDKDMLQELEELFGSSEKSVIAAKVFGESSEAKHLRKQLESIIHPRVEKLFLDWVKKNQSEDYIFNLVPLLFEAGLEHRYQEIVLICIEPEIQLQRLRNRHPELDNEALLKRISSQMTQDSKKSRATYCIDNSGNFSELRTKCLDFINFLNCKYKKL